MNTTGIIRYTASPSSLGTSFTSVALSGAVGPFRRGKITRVTVEKTAGPGTTVSIRFREGVAGRIRLEYTAETLDADKQPLPASYDTSNLVMEVATDDGTNATDLDIFVDIEGPY